MKKKPGYLPLGVAAIIFWGTCFAHSARNNKELNLNNKLFNECFFDYQNPSWSNFIREYLTNNCWPIIKPFNDPGDIESRIINPFSSNSLTLDKDYKINTENSMPITPLFDRDTHKKRAEKHISKNINVIAPNHKDQLTDFKTIITSKLEQSIIIPDFRQIVIQGNEELKKAINESNSLLKYKNDFDGLKTLISEQREQLNNLDLNPEDIAELVKKYYPEIESDHLQKAIKEQDIGYILNTKSVKPYLDGLFDKQRGIIVRIREDIPEERLEELDSRIKKIQSHIGKTELQQDSDNIYIKNKFIRININKKDAENLINEKKKQISSISDYDELKKFCKSEDNRYFLDYLKESIKCEVTINYKELNQLSAATGNSDFNPLIKSGETEIPYQRISEVFNANGIESITFSNKLSKDLSEGGIGTKISATNTILNKKVISHRKIEDIINGTMYVLSPKINYGSVEKLRDWEIRGSLSAHKVNLSNAEYLTNSFWISMIFPKMLGTRTAGYVGKTHFYINAAPMIGLNIKAQGEIISGGFSVIKNFGFLSTNLNLGVSSIKQGDIEVLLGLTDQYPIAEEDIKGYWFPHGNLGVSLNSRFGMVSANAYPGIKLKEEISPGLQMVYSLFLSPGLSFSFNPLTKSSSASYSIRF